MAPFFAELKTKTTSFPAKTDLVLKAVVEDEGFSLLPGDLVIGRHNHLKVLR